MTRWTYTHLENGTYIADLDGVSWHKAPLPGRWHRCRPQTRGNAAGPFIDRCACGAYRFDGDRFWVHKNWRRK